MIFIFVFILSVIGYVPITAGQAKMPTSKCEMNVADLSALGGATFDMKIEDVKKHYKTVRVFSPSVKGATEQFKIYSLRPAIADKNFKTDLATVDLAHSNLFGITSLALNFLPKTKLTPDELFTKINLETGLTPSNWSYNDFGGQGNYRKWDVVCNDFHGSFIAQTGYMNRFTIWRNPNSDLEKKPIDLRNIGD